MPAATPFANATPDRIIWVSPTGSDNNSGSQAAPLKSIQLALDRATPGTAILLKPGNYTGNFELHKDGTQDDPIWIAAANGPGTATITAASNSASVITVQGEDNVIIRDLKIVGGSNGIQISQSGTNYTNLAKNVVVEGNTIIGAVVDGIKVSQTVNAHVINNVIDRAGGEGIDFVGVTGSAISGNEISHVTGSSAGMFVKAGSSDILISQNYIHDIVADGLLVGGWSSAGGFLPGTSYEARDIEVTGNVVDNAGRRPLAVMGGQEVDIHHNFFGSIPANQYAVYVGNGSPYVSPPPPSKNVSIHDNVFDRSVNFSRVDPGSTGIVFSNNIKNGVIEGDMRTSVPDESPAYADVWPDALLDAFVWPTSARWGGIITGTSSADTLNGTARHDLMNGASGVDTMNGGKGDDTYSIGNTGDKAVELASSGIDTAQAYIANYALPANVENLTVLRSGGGTYRGNELNNIFMSGAGYDVFTGAGGQDLFVFAPGRGRDTITDFVAGSGGKDTVDLSAFTSVDSLADVLARSSQSGSNTVIAFSSGETLTLNNVARGSLSAGDFIFDV